MNTVLGGIMDNRFLEKQARHLKTDELLDYLHLARLPPLLRNCVYVIERDAARREEDFFEEFEQKRDELKEEVEEELNKAEETLLSSVMNASYENLEEVIMTTFDELRKKLDIPAP